MAASSGAQVEGVDFSPNMIDAAKGEFAIERYREDGVLEIPATAMLAVGVKA